MRLPVRFLLEEPATGAENMARDLALLAEGIPTVRLYGWKPACLSLGRAQTEAVVDAELARGMGVDVVQRPTGGGAILHNEEEVTYAVVLPRDHPGVTADIRDSFRFISNGVVAAFHALGVDATLGEGEGGRDALCYLRQEGVSIYVGGRKISGGAQRRTEAALLQHGTVIVERDEERMAALLRAPVEAVRSGVTSLREEGVDVARTVIEEALLEGFAKALDAERLDGAARPPAAALPRSGGWQPNAWTTDPSPRPAAPLPARPAGP